LTLQNAALVEEASAAAQSLRQQADQLAGVVNTFQLEGGEAGKGGKGGKGGQAGRSAGRSRELVVTAA
jgi:hypothetical protein